METKCRKMIHGVGVALMLAVHTTACGESPINLDDIFADFDDDSWLQAASFTGRVEFAGYKLGESYHNLTNGGRMIYFGVLKHYTHLAALNPPFHGLESVNMCLSSSSHSLMSMNASRIDFKGRQDLMNEGLSTLQDLGRHFGILLSRFKFTAPDWPYWPSRKHGYLWEGLMPELLKVDDSLWPTAKTIFATSDTNMGDYSVQVRLGVVDYDEYEMSISLNSKSASEKSEKEFQAAFRAKHNGKTYDEWSVEQQYRNSPEFKINEKRKPFTNRLEVAGWTLDAPVDMARCRRAPYNEQIAGGWCAKEGTPEPFLDIFPYSEVMLGESNRVANIILRSNRIRDASSAMKWFRKTKEFLVGQGMDDCYEEVICDAEEMDKFFNPQSINALRSCDMCKLQWVDKSKTLYVSVKVHMRMPNEVCLDLSVRRLKQGVNEYIWRQCMEAARKRRKAEKPAVLRGANDDAKKPEK